MTRLLAASLLGLLAIHPALAEREPVLMKWTVRGAERAALVFAPETSDKNKAPVIFAFHGHGGNMRFAARGMRLQDFWPEAIIVYPDGLPTPGIVTDREGRRSGWQNKAGDQNDRDLKFVDAILATLRENYPVDDNRIYATGFSNGGLFTYLLLSQRPNVFAAFAPGGAVLLASMELAQPRPVLHFGGREDQLARFAKQEATIGRLRQFNHCNDATQSCGTNCTLYPSSANAPVETYIHSGGHLYPPAVTPLIIKFFQEHPRS